MIRRSMKYQSDKSTITKAISKNIFLFAEYLWGNEERKGYFYKKFAGFQEYIIKKINNTTKDIISINIARGFGKSKLVAVLYAIWAGFVDRRQYILLVGGSIDKAEQNLRDIKNLIEQPKFKRIFPYNKRYWRADFISLEILDRQGLVKHRLVIQAVGAGKHIAGLSEGDARPDLIIPDDGEKPETAQSPDQVEKLERWVNQVLLPGRSKQDRLTGRSAKVIFINTPHAVDCFTTRLMELKWSRDVDVVKLPALVNSAKLSKLLGIPMDHSIWEEMHTTKQLRQERANYILRGALAEFEMEYQMNLEAQRTIRFDPKKAVYITTEDAQKTMRSAKLIAIFDMAYTIKTYSDYIGISIAAHLPDSTINHLVGDKKKMLQDEFYDYLVNLKKLYGDSIKFYAETKQIELLMAYIRERNIRSGESIEVFPIKQNVNMSKENRIGRLLPYYNGGYLRFVKDPDGHSPNGPLIAELFSWQGKKQNKPGVDDASDACAWQVDFAIGSLLHKEVEKEKHSMDHDTSVEYFRQKEEKKTRKRRRALPGRRFFNGH